MASEARVFHEGERAMQARENRAEEAALLGRRMVRDYLTAEHRDFFDQLPFLVVGARDRERRVDGTLLDALLLDLETDFYLCGPPPFMASLLDALAERRGPDERIHLESFGPASG